MCEFNERCGILLSFYLYANSHALNLQPVDNPSNRVINFAHNTNIYSRIHSSANIDFTPIDFGRILCVCRGVIFQITPHRAEQTPWLSRILMRKVNVDHTPLIHATHAQHAHHAYIFYLTVHI